MGLILGIIIIGMFAMLAIPLIDCNSDIKRLKNELQTLRQECVQLENKFNLEQKKTNLLIKKLKKQISRKKIIKNTQKKLINKEPINDNPINNNTPKYSNRMPYQVPGPYQIQKPNNLGYPNNNNYYTVTSVNSDEHSNHSNQISLDNYDID